jgi:TolB-like protein
MDEDTQISSGRPIVAVLPFTVAEKDGEVSRLAEGMHEEICGELTRFRSLQVISPASAAVVADLADDAVGARLGASHVLRGRMRRIGARLQLTASLSSARTSAQLWSERFNFVSDDVIDFEDQVVARIAATLNVKLEEMALADARRRPLKSLAAYDLTLRGLSMVRQGTREANDAAQVLFNQALAIDPLYARGYSGLSLSWFNQWNCQFWDRFEEASQKAYLHARRALELDDSDAMTHLIIAQVALFRCAWEQAAWYLDRALMLCPNDADLLTQAAVLEIFLGRAQSASVHVDHAMQINPYHSNDYFAIGAMAAIFSGGLEKGLELWARCDSIPLIDIPAFAAAAHAHLGRLDLARAEFERFVAGYREKIAFGKDFMRNAPVEWLFEVNPFRRSEDLDFLREGFRMLDQALAKPVGEAKPGAASAILASAGSGWIAEFGGQRAIIPDLKGLHDIRRLLEAPGAEIHCLDLAEREAEVPGGDAVLDEKARATLKARIRDLQEELAEAEDMNDIGRAERLRSEMDQIVEALSAALGLGGRRRKLGDLSEKARTAVTWRIRHAQRRIEAAHPVLGRHLVNSLRTGTFCVYRPETPIAWSFSGP